PIITTPKGTIGTITSISLAYSLLAQLFLFIVDKWFLLHEVGSSPSCLFSFPFYHAPFFSVSGLSDTMTCLYLTCGDLNARLTSTLNFIVTSELPQIEVTFGSSIKMILMVDCRLETG
ncbi:hypothetical protein ACJX0J_019106, partial [Zea mays]